MMSKRFKQKTCVYCGRAGASEAPDHVFARSLFPEKRQTGIPMVPACGPCNNAKSRLEHYLATLLPFASQHPEASELLTAKTPRRLARNLSLHRELAEGQGQMLVRENGTTTSRMTLAFESDKLIALFQMILRGLVAHHWNVIVPQEYFVEAGVLTSAGDRFARELFLLKSAQHVAENLGDGLVLYEGVQGVGAPALSIWRFQLYGGTNFADGTGLSQEISSDIWAMSGPTPMTELFSAE